MSDADEAARQFVEEIEAGRKRFEESIKKAAVADNKLQKLLDKMKRQTDDLLKSVKRIK